MGAIPIEAEEYPGRPRGDARRSLDGEPCNVEQDERSAAAAAAAAAQQYYYYASQQQQHHQQAPPLAYEEWQELATNLGQLHAGQEFNHMQDHHHHQYSSNHHHQHHHESFEARNMRLHEQSGMAAPYGGYGGHSGGGGGGYAAASGLSYAGLPSGGCSSMDDDEMALGAPPLLPPSLKRARACSYSPHQVSMGEFLSDEEEESDQRRQ